jgi:magnesium transporter
MVHALFSPEVRLMLQEGDEKGMQTFCETLHPATVAEALADELDVEEAWRFLQHTAIRDQAAIFEYFPLDWQVKMVEGTGQQHIAKLLEQMSHDDRADLLRRLRPRVVESLLRLVDEADRRDMAALVKYPGNSVGALMTTDYAALPGNLTASEALDRLRLLAPKSETIYYIYILDDQRRLLGVLSLRDLIVAPRHAIIRDLMEKEMVTARVAEDREQLARDMARYDLLAMPVVDEQNRLVGIVTHDDVIDVVVAEATEDVQRMGGVEPMVENYLDAPLVKVWWKRASWLSILFLAELFTFTALSHFEDAIAEVVVLSLFVPLCISTGGNSGSQAATLITRAMALGQVTIGSWFRVLRHELLMGIALGITLGLIGFVRGALTPEAIRQNPVTRPEAFQVRMPLSEPALARVGDTDVYQLRKGVEETIVELHDPTITPPEGEDVTVEEKNGYRVYSFPPKCTMRHGAVDRWKLALVISQAVAGICLWGTLIGSMLPIIFKRFGADPGIASSPFVATFVDVTGIIIYFTIATIWLL